MLATPGGATKHNLAALTNPRELQATPPPVKPVSMTDFQVRCTVPRAACPCERQFQSVRPVPRSGPPIRPTKDALLLPERYQSRQAPSSPMCSCRTQKRPTFPGYSCSNGVARIWLAGVPVVSHLRPWRDTLFVCGGAERHRDNKRSSHFSTQGETLPPTRSANANNALRASPTG